MDMMTPEEAAVNFNPELLQQQRNQGHVDLTLAQEQPLEPVRNPLAEKPIIFNQQQPVQAAQPVDPVAAAEPVAGPSRPRVDEPIQPDAQAPAQAPVLAQPANEPVAGPSQPREETEEDREQAKLRVLESLFPDTDPEFLHAKIVEQRGKEDSLNGFINEGLEHKGKDWPTRKEYEERQEVRSI